MSLDRRMNKQTVAHLYNGALLRCLKDDIMKFVGKWMQLEKIILDEVTQTQKDNYDMYSLISGY